MKPPISTTEILAIVSLESIQRNYGFNLQDCMIHWAISEMQRGVESISLYILAGMSLFDSAFEVENYFLKALHELQIKFPGKAQAIRNYAGFIGHKFLHNELSEMQGSAILSDICMALDYATEYQIWYKLYEERDIGLISETHFKKAVKYHAKQLLKTLSVE